MTRRITKLSPLERLVKSNTTKLKNLSKKRKNIAAERAAELKNLDEQIAEVDLLLRQLKK